MFWGENQRLIRIVTVYRPVYSIGAASTYQQHKKHFNAKNSDDCPRQSTLDDLKTCLNKWEAEDNLLIVTGDFNDNVRGPDIRNFFHQWNMHEVIISVHGNQAPNTFRDGRRPIDGVFCSQALGIINCGYSSIDWGAKADHRMLWVDFNATILFGDNEPPLWSPKARRLQLIDPRIVNRFIAERRKHAIKYKLSEQVETLLQRVQFQGLTEQNIECIEELDNLRVQGILIADKKM